jgi:hypothetical protein
MEPAELMSDQSTPVTVRGIVVPNLSAPDVVPGGYLSDGRFNQLQKFAQQVADAINNPVTPTPPAPPVPPPVWGMGLVITTGGVYTLDLQDNFVFINIGGTPTPPLSLVLPPVAEAIGPYTIYIGDDTVGALNTSGTDTILVTDITDGTGPAVHPGGIVIGSAGTGMAVTVVPQRQPADVAWVVVKRVGNYIFP